MRRRRGMTPPVIHKRLTHDLPHGAQVASTVEDDPYEAGGRILVLRSIRDDPLGGLYARGQIDDAQFAAGRQWQRYYEMAGIGQVIAMDPTKEPVDGHGATRSDITDSQIEAFRQLIFAGRELGFEDYKLVEMVLGQGLAIKEICRRRGELTESRIKFWGARFRGCLETLARLYGFAQSVDKRRGT